MNKKAKDKLQSGTMAGLLTAVAGMSIMGSLLGGLKMFGTGDIPKGVVRELMEGVMDGLISHFEIKIDDLKRENKDLKEKVEDLEPYKERYEELLETTKPKKKPSKTQK